MTNDMPAFARLAADRFGHLVAAAPLDIAEDRHAAVSFAGVAEDLLAAVSFAGLEEDFLAAVSFVGVVQDFVPADPSVALLDDMMARVGVDGLVAAMADPGLLAEVDQHAAAVRDALAAAGREVGAESLASYARSIEFAARRMGRPVPAAGEAHLSGAAWRSADWHVMRLLAVCAIADSAGLF